MDQHCWKAKTSMNTDMVNTRIKILNIDPFFVTTIVTFSQVMFCDLTLHVVCFQMPHTTTD